MNPHLFAIFFVTFTFFCGNHFAYAEASKKILHLEPLSKNMQKDFGSVLLRELTKRNQYKNSYYTLSTTDKEKAKTKSTLYYKKGRRFFDNGDSKMAQRYFEKAISLDPFPNQYVYALAICAYRNGDHTRSLALLETLNGENVDVTEASYYEALNNMKLNDTDAAIKTFSYVIDANDPVLSPSAAMYKGLLLKQKGDFESAKLAFQYILDTTTDPKLDKKAETEIEQIIAFQQFEAEGKKKFSYSIFTGFIYDTNVLNIANNNATLNLKAYRLLYGANLDFKAVHKYKHSLTPRLSFSDIYSVDTSFNSDATIQSTDPLQLEFALPYTYRFSIANAPSSWTLIPTYSQIYMSLDEAGRKLVYSTTALGSEFATQFSEKWTNTLRLDFSSDTFHPETTPVNDQSALKYGFLLTNTRLFDTRGTKTLSFNLNYIINDAEGTNSVYDRWMTSLVGTLPISKKWISYSKLDYITQDFSKSETFRKDKGYIFTLGGFYNINNNLSLNIYAQHQDNASTVDLYEFDKLTVMTMLSYNTGFF